MTKKREEFDNCTKWCVTDLYQDEEKFEQAYKELEDSLVKYQDYKNHILDSAKNLYELLEMDNNLNKKLEQVYIYAHIQNDQDTANTKYQTLYGRACKLYEKYNEESSFIVPEILKGSIELIEKYIKELPKLKEYERVLKEIFRFQKYTLSEPEEKLLSSMTSIFNTPDDVYSLLTDADMKFGTIKVEDKDVELTEKSYRKMIESSNRSVRKNAFEKLFGTYGEFKNTYASLLASEAKKNNKLASIRGYKSALNKALYANNIPDEIYTNLINAVKKNIKPLSRFWQLKKQALGVSTLHLYDTYASITKEIKHEYTFEEAKELIMKSLSVLGDDYITALNKAFDEGWIDYCANDAKRNGAYCTACYNVHPYVLLSFDGTFNNVSTLAHELGHAMHYYYAIKNQSYQDYGYSIFVAEVASQVNQIILSKYLIEHTNNIEEKKYLIDDLICDFKAAIYRQTMFADFEKRIHELDQNGEILTYENMCDIYYKLNKEYFGENIVVDDLIKYEWERIPHFYMNFYVYQYATAYAAAIKIAMDILNQKEGAVDKYLEFLSLGCTKTPIESLKVAGVDITKESTFKETFEYFNNLVEELEGLYENKEVICNE